MDSKNFQVSSGTAVNSMSNNAKIILVGIQKKIQNLHSDIGNSGFLQQLLYEAGQLISLSDKEAGAKIERYAKGMDFYLNGGSDNLEVFYHCKAETLSIIAKHLSK